MLVASCAYADNQAIELLNKMHQAIQGMTYKGILVYRKNDTLSTLMVDHSMIDDVKRERVVRLNDAGNEFSRELKNFSFSAFPAIHPDMMTVYSFDMGVERRVADMPCQIITARPKDRARYLQKYCIHTETGLLLDYRLIGEHHKPVEHFMFTSIEYFDHRPVEDEMVAGSAIVPAVAAKDSKGGMILLENRVSQQASSTEIVTRKKSDDKIGNIAVSDANSPDIRALGNGWTLNYVPKGFNVRVVSNDSPSTQQHFVVSDGLSSISLFVSPQHEPPQHKAIAVNSGALNVLSAQKNNHRITAVGEVPESTMKQLLKHLNYQRP